jgi:hypothetical protein
MWHAKYWSIQPCSSAGAPSRICHTHLFPTWMPVGFAGHAQPQIQPPKVHQDTIDSTSPAAASLLSTSKFCTFCPEFASSSCQRPLPSLPSVLPRPRSWAYSKLPSPRQPRRYPAVSRRNTSTCGCVQDTRARVWSCDIWILFTHS